MSGRVTVHVAPTRDQAWDEAERALHWWSTSLPAARLRHAAAAGGGDALDPGGRDLGQPFAVGTPEDVLAVLEPHKDVDLDEMVIQFNHPGMAASKVP